MKIQFERQDSFYKITKTIEKIPDKRKVIFSIDADNNMFVNDRWWQQFRELCESKELDYLIKATSTKVKNYCDRIWLPSEYNLRSPFATVWTIIYSFFFKIRDFHYYSTHQKKYLKYLIFGVEALLVLFLATYVYSILVPKAIITITPSYDIEDVSYNFRVVSDSALDSWYADNAISIPYSQGVLPYHRILRTSIQSIRYSAQTAKGIILLTNTSNREYALKPYTRFITDTNLIFKTSQWINVPAKGEIEVELLADDVDDAWQLMGIRGNIASGTVMYIRNLAESRTRKLVVGKAITDFSGGDTLARGVVTQKDINAFNALARKTVNESVSQIIRDSIKDKAIVPLMYKSLMSGLVTNVVVDAKLGQPMLEFDGSVDANIIYHYIKQEDLNNAINHYFAQRSIQSLRLVSIQPESLKMFDPIVITTWVYSIPMTISTFWSYNFQSDVGGVLSQLTQYIAWKSKEDARQEILSYPDISVAKISISPFWYQTIPSIKSRIEFKVAESESLEKR
jgi:hypothetical protein